MSEPRETFLYPIFRFLLARRWWVIAIYTVLLGVSIPFALRVHQDNAIDRLIVADDPDYMATKAFGKVFGEGEYVVLFAEADHPFAPDVLAALEALDAKLKDLPRVSSNSLLSIYHQARPAADPVKDPAAFQEFATGTDLFSRQGLVGRDFYGLPLILDVHGTEQRAEVLKSIEDAVAGIVANPAPLKALRRVGEPYVNDHLNRETNAGGMRLFPVFGVFVVVLVLGLYRSKRALAAFIIAMAVNVAMAVGFIGVLGGTFSIVSALVPMTILITCLATLVYLHSRFVEQPPDRPIAEHHVFALANKFLACTASVLATAVGFAALAVSDIRPIREMGLWVAAGLVMTWVITFTLFPALQKVLNTPTQVERKTAAQWFLKVVDFMPRFSYRWRWVTVPASLVLCAMGAVALFGLPGVIEPMQMMTDPLSYINPRSQLYSDTRRVEQLMPGLSQADVWLKGKVGTMNQAGVIRGLDAFQHALDAEPMVGATVGAPSILRMVRYVGGKGDKLPTDPDELESMADELESLVQQDPLLSRFVDKSDMSQTHFTVLTRINEFPTWQELGTKVGDLWQATVDANPALLEFVPDGEARWTDMWGQVTRPYPALAGIAAKDALRFFRDEVVRHPALAGAPADGDTVWADLAADAATDLPGLSPVLADRAAPFWKALTGAFRDLVTGIDAPTVVGVGRLQSKVAHNLVPTLTESFALTVAIIFSVFLFIFRNGAARLMAMIPSLFAILVMFIVMRIVGIELSVTTILIASTVLGTSENDQIHFFYHFLEGRAAGDGTTDAGLRHTTLIAGRSIVFATLINACGFLAFALSDLPPIRQFAVLAATAFLLSMIADFTALPGALWMVFKDKPKAKGEV